MKPSEMELQPQLLLSFAEQSITVINQQVLATYGQHQLSAEQKRRL